MNKLTLLLKNLPQKLIRAFALHGSSIQSYSELAAIAEMTESEVEAWMAVPGVLAVLQAAATKAEAEGKTQVVLARKAHTNFLNTIFKASKDLDISEIPDLAKVVARAIEQADRVRLAERDSENLPLIHITFGSNMAMKTEVAARAKPVEPVQDLSLEHPGHKSISPAHALGILDVVARPVTPLKSIGGDE